MRSQSSCSARGGESTSARRTRKARPPSTSPAPRATSPWRSSWLEVSPQRAESRERGERRGLGAQHPRTEARLHEAGPLERGLLLGGEACFRSGGDDGGALEFHFLDGSPQIGRAH